MTLSKSQLIKRIFKPTVFFLSLVPFLILCWNFFNDTLSANPLDDITDETGTWTLRFLLITLSITPLRKIFHWHNLINFRKMFGLFAFFYGTLHFITYIWFDKFFEWQEILTDISKRPFITIGFASFVLMIPLAVTSFQKMIRLLKKKWQILHRLIYIITIGGVVHYWWLVKSDIQRPLMYAILLTVLLGYRIVIFFISQKKV